MEKKYIIIRAASADKLQEEVNNRLKTPETELVGGLATNSDFFFFQAMLVPVTETKRNGSIV